MMNKPQAVAWLAVLCWLVAGCHRAPQTAAELQKSLPHEYQGELRLQGEQTPRKITVGPHDFTVVDEHTLEFNRVHYQLPAGGEGDANVRGSISAPGLIIRVESLSGTADVDGGDVLKPGTFQGKLSGDLQKMDATWKTGFGQTVTLSVEAEP